MFGGFLDLYEKNFFLSRNTWGCQATTDQVFLFTDSLLKKTIKDTSPLRVPSHVSDKHLVKAQVKDMFNICMDTILGV